MTLSGKNKLTGLIAFIGKQQKLFAWLVALVILVAGYLLILQGPLRLYAENVVVEDRLIAEIKLATNNLNDARNYSSQLYKLSTEESRWLNLVLPEKPDPSSLIEHLTSLARRAGFNVASITLDEANNQVEAQAATTNGQQNIGKIVVRLNLTGGGYQELKRFLDLAQSSIMMIDVTSINFGGKNSAYDLALIVYYYRNQ